MINGVVLSIFWVCVVERMILYSILIFDVSFSGLDFLGSNASVIWPDLSRSWYLNGYPILLWISKTSDFIYFPDFRSNVLPVGGAGKNEANILDMMIDVAVFVGPQCLNTRVVFVV